MRDLGREDDCIVFSSIRQSSLTDGRSLIKFNVPLEATLLSKYPDRWRFREHIRYAEKKKT